MQTKSLGTKWHSQAQERRGRAERAQNRWASFSGQRWRYWCWGLPEKPFNQSQYQDKIVGCLLCRWKGAQNWDQSPFCSPELQGMHFAPSSQTSFFQKLPWLLRIEKGSKSESRRQEDPGCWLMERAKWMGSSVLGKELRRSSDKRSKRLKDAPGSWAWAARGWYCLHGEIKTREGQGWEKARCLLRNCRNKHTGGWKWGCGEWGGSVVGLFLDHQGLSLFPGENEISFSLSPYPMIRCSSGLASIYMYDWIAVLFTRS